MTLGGKSCRLSHYLWKSVLSTWRSISLFSDNSLSQYFDFLRMLFHYIIVVWHSISYWLRSIHGCCLCMVWFNFRNLLHSTRDIYCTVASCITYSTVGTLHIQYILTLHCPLCWLLALNVFYCSRCCVHTRKGKSPPHLIFLALKIGVVR